MFQASNEYVSCFMKTKILLELKKELSKLNDSYAHYLFIWEQFIVDNKSILLNNENELTTQAYKSNKFARQFNVEMKYLSNSHEDAEQLILKSIYFLSYSMFERYLFDIHRFAQNLDDSIQELNQGLTDDDIKDTLKIEKVFIRLNIDLNNSFDGLEIKTLDYIRLRRNRIVHQSVGTQGKILDIINNNGTNLNKYWDKHLHKGRYCIDFKRKEIDYFERLELFDLLFIIRQLASKIDGIVLNNLDRQKILEFIYQEFEVNSLKSIKNHKVDRIKTKFTKYWKVEYGFDIQDGDLENFAFKVV